MFGAWPNTRSYWMVGLGVEMTSANQHQSVRGFPTELMRGYEITEHQAADGTRILETTISKAAREQVGSVSSEPRASFGPPKPS